MNHGLRNKRGNSIGIHNINARLKILYGEEYGLHIESMIGKGTKVWMVIPKIEGRKKIAKEVPDILITDIDMPFMTGTELLAIVQEKYPKVLSFVVSGYNDFAYVKELEETTEKIMAGISEFLQTRLTLCISGHSYSMESIHTAYMETIGLLMERKFCQKDEILFCGEGRERSDKMALHFQEEKERQVRFHLAACDGDALCRVILKETGLSNCERRGWSYLEVRQTVRQIMNVLQERHGSTNIFMRK